jgi:hypothetical protein
MSTDKDFECKIVGRTGPFLSIVILKKSDRPMVLVRAAIICDARKAPGTWIYAAPLAPTSKERILTTELNIYDFVFLGHPNDAQSTFSIQSTLEDMTAMIRPRLTEMAESNANLVETLTSTCKGFFSAIIGLQTEDSLKQEKLITSMDEELAHHIEVRLVDSVGAIHDVNLPIGSSTVAQWMANYLGNEFQENIKNLVSRL